MKRMTVHLSKTHIGDTGVIEGILGHPAVEISIVYEDTSVENSKALLFGKLTVCEYDYDNLVKALTRAKEYVYDDDRDDHVSIPFNL